MSWAQEFWNRIFPTANFSVDETEFADVILRDTGKNISHFIHVLKSMTGLSASEIKFYTERMPVAIFKQLPKQSAIEVAQSLEATGAKIELRFKTNV
jgi:ribosomal protein L7/L12